MQIKAYAKVNPILNVVGKREDGYHEIDTVMQTVSYYDLVDIELTDGEISVDMGGEVFENNTAFLAAKLFFEKTGIQKGAKICIEKNIPVAAGLGGGSSDAAAVLKGLNELCDYPLTQDELLELAVKIGADVPFFIIGGACRCKGIGEKLTKLKVKQPWYVVLFKNQEKQATAQMYKVLDSKDDVVHPDVDAFCEAYQEDDDMDMFMYGDNSFACLWELDDIIFNYFMNMGAVHAGVSGSGPTVFAYFDDEELAFNAVDGLSGKGWTGMGLTCE